MKAARLGLKTSLYWCAVVTTLAGTPSASAEPLQHGARRSDATASDELYRSGLELVRRARHSEACKKFAASRELAHTIENTLEVARCHKHLGQSASAWRLFRAAVSLARARGDARAEQAARQAAEGLEPDLARITVDISEARTPELQISRNGVPVPPELLGQPMPVDTGEHTIEASAPGKRSWSTRVDVTTPFFQDRRGAGAARRARADLRGGFEPYLHHCAARGSAGSR